METSTAEKTQQKSYQLGIDDKIVQFMVYLSTGLCWGDVLMKEKVRASTWLRTNAAPDNMTIHHARYLITISPGCSLKPQVFNTLHIPVDQVLAYHIVPPAADPVDYDPSEPNRKMAPLTVMFSTFILDGFLRVASVSSVGKYLDVNREAFTPIYNAEIRSQFLPLGTVRVPYLMVRQNTAQFATHGE